MNLRSILVICFLLSSNLVFAKKFTSKFCEFTLPQGWECALEGTEWVCQSTNEDRKKEAIIILAAKERGAQDSLMEYEAYLKKAKTFQLPGGRTQVSESKFTNKSEINGKTWIDSLHLASEVPGFYTRYLATVEQNLGVAVTFSVAKDHYDAYKELFDRIIGTLRVFAPKKYQQGGDYKLSGNGGSAIDGVKIQVNQPGIQPPSAGQRKKQPKGGSNDMLLYGIIAAAVVGFILLKKKKKPVKKKKKKKKKKKSS